MRVIVRGKSAIEQLADVFDSLIARLEAAGVDEVAGVSIYLTPLISGSAVTFVDEHGRSEDSFEIAGGAPTRKVEPDGSDRVLTRGVFVEKEDAFNLRHVRLFCRNLGVSFSFYERFFAMTPTRTNAVFFTDLQVELSTSERWRADIICALSATAAQSFRDTSEMVTWFRGPFPASRFKGRTPLEQIEIGGPDVALAIARALAIGSRRRERGHKLPWPPPRHFDQTYRRPGNTDF